MCGICGYLAKERLPLAASLLSLRHRGPDDRGLWEGELAGQAAGLGHARLAVIDLSPLGHQPMATGAGEGDVRVVFNGEIYNFLELRRELEGLGHTFRSHSDTEALLLGYLQWGDGVVDRLRGMFAFALYDRARERALLARDRLGVKPLYYQAAGGELRFASELKGVLALLPKRPALEARALRDYLTYLYVPAPRSIFEGISQLRPGHLLVFEKGEVSERRYWRLPPLGPTRPRAQVVRELRSLLEETVQQHLLSDVPLGAFLSGGLDSTTLVALMARASARPVKTFCMTFEAEAGLYDERQYARAVADRYGTDHTEIPVQPDLIDLLPKSVQSFDEPFGNPTALLVNLLSQKTREHVTVALAGDGGDEIFLGYPRYQGAELSALYRRVPQPLRRFVGRLAGAIPESTRGRHELRRAREFLEGSVLAPREMYASWISYFTEAEQQRLLVPELWAATAGAAPHESLFRAFPEGRSFVDQCQAADLETFLPGNLLTYSDRMSMAHALEVRVPFCDHRLVEFMSALPAEQKMPRLQTKSLLREAVADLLPPSVQKRKKLGFNPPVGIWLRGALRPMLREILSAEACRTRGVFEPAAVQGLLAELDAGKRDRSLHVWALLNFEIWARAYLDA